MPTKLNPLLGVAQALEASMGGLTLSIEIAGRPVTVNRERQMGHWSGRSKWTAELRTTSSWMWKAVALEGKLPRPMETFIVVSQPIYPNKANHPDTGSCYPTVKAIVDGARDAGVVVDDKPTNVLAMIELPAILTSADHPAVRSSEPSIWVGLVQLS